MSNLITLKRNPPLTPTSLSDLCENYLIDKSGYYSALRQGILKDCGSELEDDTPVFLIYLKAQRVVQLHPSKSLEKIDTYVKAIVAIAAE